MGPHSISASLDPGQGPALSQLHPLEKTVPETHQTPFLSSCCSCPESYRSVSETRYSCLGLPDLPGDQTLPVTLIGDLLSEPLFFRRLQHLLYPAEVCGVHMWDCTRNFCWVAPCCNWGLQTLPLSYWTVIPTRHLVFVGSFCLKAQFSEKGELT